MMNFWKEFLDSLSTRGGSIFLLCFAVAGFSVTALLLIFHKAPTESVTLFQNAFSAFTGSLLTLLTTQGKAISNGDGNGNGEKIIKG